MKMRKIVAIVAAVLMLCSILPISAIAADTTITVTGATGALASDKLSISWASGDYQVVNYKNTSSTAIRVSDSNHFRSYVGNLFTVSGGEMSQVVIQCTDNSYLFSNSANKVSDGWTVSVNGTNVTYTATSGSATELSITIGKQSRLSAVVITPAAGASSCDHSGYTCGNTCSTCGKVFVCEFDNACDNICNICGGANPDWADHVYDGDYDAACNVCGAAREVNYPTADTAMSIADALTLGAALPKGEYTPGKYYITGEVTEVYNTTYGNLYLTDGTNTITVYGIYSADGETRYDAMDIKPEAGNTITVYGVIGNYNGTAQMKNGWLTEIIGGCEHKYAYECSTLCSLCGKGEREAACVNDGYPCADGLCVYCGNDVAAVEHDFDSIYDPDCNYGCGYTREVPEVPEVSEQTIELIASTGTLASDSSSISWSSANFQFVNYKGGTAIRTSDTDHYRCYAGSKIVISGLNNELMAQVQITATSSSYANVLVNSGASEGWTVSANGMVVTYVAAAGATELVIESLTAQSRCKQVYIIPFSDEPACEHEYTSVTQAATCTEDGVITYTCSVCGDVTTETIPALGHTYGEGVETQAATCTEGGEMTYTCSVCGDVKVETTDSNGHSYGEDGICTVCGAEKLTGPTITFDADKTQRTEYTAETQKWENEGLVLVNNKADSTNDVGDYSNPGRFYKSSEIIISYTGMTALVIDASTVGGSKYSDPWADILTAAGLNYENAGDVYTVTFAEPTDSITLTCSAQCRASSIMAVGAVCEHEYAYDCSQTCSKCGELTRPEAAHSYFYPCDTFCEICFEETNPEATHTIVAVEAKAATCTEMGNIAYWYCENCGSAWLDADCTQNTNMMAVKLPLADHTYDDEYDADCNVCGDVREVPEKPVEIVYGDTNGDGIVNTIDVAMLQQYAGGWDVTLGAGADANGDGIINTIDVALVQQLVGGWDVTLGPAVSEENPLFNDVTLENW